MYLFGSELAPNLDSPQNLALTRALHGFGFISLLALLVMLTCIQCVPVIETPHTAISWHSSEDPCVPAEERLNTIEESLKRGKTEKLKLDD